MLRKFIVLVIFFSLYLIDLSGQDIHFSQFFNSPLNVNPALTGIFNGNSRYQLNYRRQWQSVPVDYLSADIAADFKLFRSENKFLGVGILFNYDRAGDLNLNLLDANLSISYSLKVSDQFLITPGISGAYVQRGYDAANAQTGNQWDGRAYNPTFAQAEIIGQESLNYIDISGGLNFRWQNSYRKYLDFGGAVQHVNSPKEFFSNESEESIERPKLLTAYFMLNYQIGGDLDILLNGLYSRQDEYNEIVGNIQTKIYLSKAKDKAIYLGVGYRLDDAWYPMIAIDYGQVYGAFSYDLNISDFEVATDGRGGPELSLRYIFSRIPDGDFKQCPIY